MKSILYKHKHEWNGDNQKHVNDTWTKKLRNSLNCVWLKSKHSHEINSVQKLIKRGWNGDNQTYLNDELVKLRSCFDTCTKKLRNSLISVFDVKRHSHEIKSVPS